MQELNPKITKVNPDTVLALIKKEIPLRNRPLVVNQKGIIRINAGKPKSINSNQYNVEVIVPGKDGVLLAKKVDFIEEKKLYPLPEPIPALPLSKVENSINNMVFLDVEQSINTSNITDMLEDKRGNIWFASEGAGVSKYDGTSFLHFTTTNGVNRLLVTCVFEDSKGNIWIGINGAGVSKYDGKTFTQITEKDGLIKNQVWSIIEDKNRNIWFATRGGICKYDGKSFTNYSEKEGLAGSWIHSILEDKKVNLWLGTDNGTIIKFDGNTLPAGQAGFTNYNEIEGIENHPIISIEEDRNGNLWFGTSGGGILRFDGESFFQFTENEGLNSNNVCDILEDKNGNLWIGTEDAGACKFDGKQFTYYTKEDGLSNNLVRSIMEDSRGNIWFGTYDGTTIYKPNSFVHYSEKEGLIGDSITSIIEDKKGNIWFGSNGSGVCKYDGNSYSYYTKNDGLSSNNIQSILEDKDGNIWFGTSNSGVNIFNGKTFIHYSEKDELNNNSINSLIQDKSGDIWLGIYGDGLSKYVEKPLPARFINYSKNGGLNNNYVWSVIEDENSNIWISTRYGGVNKYDGKTFTQYAQKEGLTDNSIYSMLDDKAGNIWFGTMNKGIVKYDGNAFTHYSKEDGLASNTIFSIIEDENGRLWLGSDGGLSCFEFISDPERNDEHKINITNFEIEDGLDNLDFMKNAVCLDSKNRLWWGTSKGVTMQDMNKLVLSKEPPIIQLNTIEIEQSFIDYPKLLKAMGTGKNSFAGIENNINLDKVKFSEIANFYNFPIKLKLPYNINNLIFHFSAIDWDAPQRIQYQYFVEGLDKEWRQLTKENSADYRNIPFGSYVFKVKAIGIASIWSETFEYSFTISPPWWFSWWAYGIYIFGIVLIIMLVFRWRTAQLKQQQRELEQKIKERTVKVVKQKDEIKVINENLKQQNEEIISQRDEIEAQRNFAIEQKEQIEIHSKSMTDSIIYAQRIQSAILPPETYITELLHENFIFNKPRDIVSGDFYWVKQVNQYIVIVAADCTGHGVPGAFMSMLGISYLNEIVQRREITQANQVLNELRSQIKHSLRQHGQRDESKDGMDIALCVIDTRTKMMQYAGAFNPLYLISDVNEEPELKEIKGDRMPVGFYHGKDKSFTNHEIQLEMGDTFYIFSDGYSDQTGGKEDKKFMSKNFKNLLIEIHEQPMYEQKEILDKTLTDWMDGSPQIDDILVIGVRV